MTIRALGRTSGRFDAVSFLDRHETSIADVVARPAGGSRLRFVLMCHRGAWSADYAVYDSVGMARAHPSCWFNTKRYCVWIHGVEVWYDLHANRQRALGNASLVLVNSQFTLAKFESLHGPLPTARVCWLATESEEQPEVLPQFSGPPTVLCLARLEAGRYKGHRELIAAWPQVVAAIPDARLVLAGGGDDLAAIRSIVGASTTASAVEVCGFVPEADVAALWRRAHVFAMPSRGEGFGIVYIEAMRYGLPVVASVHDAGQEVNVDGVTGYNVNLDVPGELADRLISLLGDRALAQRMGNAGHERWRAHFRYSAFRDRLLTIMQDFTGERIALPQISNGSRT